MSHQLHAKSAAVSFDDGTDGPARILVVDDDERNLLALTQVLKELGEVVTATSGREALRHLLADEFAVILLDVFMPGMDGYEVADLIRQRKHTARIPIIFLSAVNKETEHLIRGYTMGAVDYVFKPVDPVVLTSKVSVFVDLFNTRKAVEAKGRAERDLREAGFRAELERLRIENELHAAQMRQTAVLEALPLALFEAVSEEGGGLVREFVAGDLSKLADDDAAALEAGSLRWEDRIHPDDRAVFDKPDPGASVLSAEYRWICGRGSYKHFIERAVPIACEPNGSVRWAGSLFDVTERKKLEQQLLHAGKMDALGQLTGGVAHDFNNVLAAVLGGATLLERRVSFEAAEKRILEQVRIAAERGVSLVRRMMTFARKQELSPEFLPPSTVCEAVAGLVEQTLGGTIELAWSCPDTELVFFADRSQLELTLVNLIINARDAMPDGGRIEVSIFVADAPERIRSPDAEYLCIEVRDEGTGIPAAVVERITEPFFTTKEVGKGTGLGLSMAVGFVEQSGGTISIDSEERRGTTVRLVMPAARRPERATGPARPSAPHSPARRQKVLVVDDDPTVRNIIAEQLRELGATVTAASDGVNALELLRSSSAKQPFELLLTDYAMPGMNGLQVLAQAREILPGLRCAVMTGFADRRVEAATPVGARLLLKPVAIEELEALLAQHEA